jgi:hypothetical protein
MHPTTPLLLHRFGIYKQSSAYIHHKLHSKNTPHRAASNVFDGGRNAMQVVGKTGPSRALAQALLDLLLLLAERLDLVLLGRVVRNADLVEAGAGGSERQVEAGKASTHGLSGDFWNFL